MAMHRFLLKVVGQLLAIIGIVGLIATHQWSSEVQRYMTVPEELFKMLPVYPTYLACIAVIIIGVLTLVGERFLKRHPTLVILLYIFSFVTGFMAIGLCYDNGNDSLLETAISALGIVLVIFTGLTIIARKPIAGARAKNPETIFAIFILLVLAVLVVGLVFPQWFDAVARSFEDPYLKAIVRKEVGKPFGFVTQSDLERLTYIDSWMGDISDLTGIEKCTGLKFLQLGYNGRPPNHYLMDITPLSNLKELTKIELTGNMIVDISPLSGLTNLTHLYLASNEIMDISPLSQLTNLSVLELWANEIVDIDPLQNLTEITELSIGQNRISDISPLAELTSLTKLKLYMNSIVDISPLSGCTNLEWLELRSNSISDISPLIQNTGIGQGDMVSLDNNPLSAESIYIYIPQLESRGVDVRWSSDISSSIPPTTASNVSDSQQVVDFPDPNLESLIRQEIGKPSGDIYQSDLQWVVTINASEGLAQNITDLSGLEYCVNLVELQLQCNSIKDISRISDLTKLTKLNLFDNEIDDITPLSSLANLTDLFLANNQISDISPLSSLNNLWWLSLQDNKISDISALSSMNKLYYLGLGYNCISDFTPLSSLTNLKSLSLSNNDVTDISIVSGLVNLEGLYLLNNQISDISPITNLTNLRELALQNNLINDIEPIVNNPGISSGDLVFLHDNPLSSTSINIYIPQLEARGVDVYYYFE